MRSVYESDLVGLMGARYVAVRYLGDAGRERRRSTELPPGPWRERARVSARTWLARAREIREKYGISSGSRPIRNRYFG